MAHRQKETDQVKQERHKEFRKIVFDYELTLKRISEITGRSEGTVGDWRMENPRSVIPLRQFLKLKEALGLPLE